MPRIISIPTAPGSLVYKCDCPVRCGNYLKVVSRTSWWDHEPYRTPDSQADVYKITEHNPSGVRTRIKFPKKRRNPPKPRQKRPPRNVQATTSTHVHSDTCNEHDAPMDEDTPELRDAVHEDTHPIPEPMDIDENMDDSLGVPDAPHTATASPAQYEDPEVSGLPRPAAEYSVEIEEEWEDLDHGEDIEGGAFTGNGTLPQVVEEPMPKAHLEDLIIAQAFIRCLENVTLDTDTIDPAVLAQLRNPPKESPDLSCCVLWTSLEIWLSLDSTGVDQYEKIRSALLRNHDIHLLSYDQVKRRAMELSGVSPVYQDMCPNSCLGFTGPFKNLSLCPMCGEDWYEWRVSSKMRRRERVPHQQFLTILLGPQLQVLYSTPQGAEFLRYRQRCTAQLKKEALLHGLPFPELKDYVHGSEYINAVIDGTITDDHIVVLLSMDGTQLYAHKASDCWVYIWVVLEHAPDVHYKKKHILVGGVIPGPKKPKNTDSFLYPGLHHTSALMKEGLPVWDHEKDELVRKDPFIAYGTADGPAMALLNGTVGHKGAQGCRLACTQKGRFKPGANHYYPASLKPDDYEIDGSAHDDIDLRAEPDPDAPTLSQRYEQNLRRLLKVRTITEFRRIRLETGLAKPTIFSGLPSTHILPIPGCFPADIMHLVALNIPELMFLLWRGKMDCDKDDNKATWDWAVLKGNLWKQHGQAVADTREYLPGSFDRPPRDPSEKINSGYKAIEFLTYLFGLGPAMFKNILPDKYWSNYCKLVHGIRILHQRIIKIKELEEAHILLIEFVEEFEELYYQRKSYQLHFVRQSIHALVHMARETCRIGPYIILSQWTMERMIGQLVRELRQPSNPYHNLSQRALRRAQVSALQAKYPELDVTKPPPAGSVDLGNGYTLLRATDTRIFSVPELQADALREFARTHPEIAFSPTWIQSPTVVRWARLSLPTGQIAKSIWHQEKCEKLRISSNIKYSLAENQVSYGEVHYYFKSVSEEHTRTYAMVQAYSPPDMDLLKEFCNTVWSCQREDRYLVIDVQSINSVVTMVPHPGENGQLGDYAGCVFVVEKMGLDVMPLAGIAEAMGSEEDDVIELVS